MKINIIITTLFVFKFWKNVEASPCEKVASLPACPYKEHAGWAWKLAYKGCRTAKCDCQGGSGKFVFANKYQNCSHRDSETNQLKWYEKEESYYFCDGCEAKCKGKVDIDWKTKMCKFKDNSGSWPATVVDFANGKNTEGAPSFSLTVFQFFFFQSLLSLIPFTYAYPLICYLREKTEK